MGLLDFIFGKTKQKYPRITDDMLQPADSVITTTEAKRIAKEVLLQGGYCEDKTDTRFEVEALADDIKQREEDLRSNIEMIAEDLASQNEENKEAIKELQADLKACSDANERSDIEAEISDYRRYVARDAAEIARAKAELAAFKANKRAFLIGWLNERLHGTDGQSADA